MGWGAYAIRIGLSLDEHAGEKEQEHSRLAGELAEKVHALCTQPEYVEIVSSLSTPEKDLDL